MKVKQLIELLQDCNPEDLVVMSGDTEGNWHSPVSDVFAQLRYAADNSYSGGTGLRELTPELIEQGYSEEDVLEEGQDCIVLWPTN